ncbi:MAG: SPASM domain-containing protein [Candidatus Bathyarchaeum sp.]|nr:MAG: SPASM domain-containing protein [Candidatus Bathyarchaeum sp.]
MAPLVLQNLKLLGQFRFGFSMYKAIFAFNHKKLKLSYSPILGSLEPSNLCNLNCVMCARDTISGRGSGLMSVETLRNVINVENRNVIRTVDFTGHGEPLLNPKLEKFIKIAKPFARKVGLTTNSTLLSKDRAKSLLDAGLDFVSFSFEGVSKEVYESIRVGANYETVFQNIHDFVALNKKLNSGCKTFLIIVDSPLTHSSLPKFVDYWAGIVDEVRIMGIHDWGGVLDSSLVEKSYSHRKLPCFEPWYHIYVRWNGDVVPCCVWEGKTKFGNVNEEPMPKIWNNSIYQKFRASLLSSPTDHCRSCNLDMLGDVFSEAVTVPHASFPFHKSTVSLAKRFITYRSRL